MWRRLDAMDRKTAAKEGRAALKDLRALVRENATLRADVYLLFGKAFGKDESDPAWGAQLATLRKGMDKWSVVIDRAEAAFRALERDE
jgi:hypothetical protein